MAYPLHLGLLVHPVAQEIYTFNTLNFSEVEIRLGIEAAEDLDDTEAAKLVASDYGWIIVIYFIITLTRAMVVFGSLPLLNKWG